MGDKLNRAKLYAFIKYSLSISEAILCVVFFLLLQISGLSKRMAEALAGMVPNFYAILFLYILLVYAGLNLFTLALDYLRSFKAEHTFGLSNQSLRSWIKDYLKKIAISCLMIIIFLTIIYWTIRNFGKAWWVVSVFIYFFLTVVLAKIFPVLIIPVFYKLDKLDNAGLKQNIVKLADRAGVKILDIYQIALGTKTKKANAAVCGIGSTKRILLSDTLIKDYTQEEIEATLAHELAHYKYRHFWKLSLYNFLCTFAGFGAIGLFLNVLVNSGYAKEMYDISVLPALMVVFIIFNILISPIFNFISCRYELQADREAVALTKNPAAFVSLMTKLSRQNLSDPDPNFVIKIFFYDHPPAGERIALFSGSSSKKT